MNKIIKSKDTPNNGQSIEALEYISFQKETLGSMDGYKGKGSVSAQTLMQIPGEADNARTTKLIIR